MNNVENNDSLIREVIVVRKDLTMRRGKQIAQACHSCMKMLLDKMTVQNESNNITTYTMSIPTDGVLNKWLCSLFTKIVLYCNSEEELLNIYNSAINMGIDAILITDSGLTEFNGVKTNTCISLGPDYKDKIDVLTGHLKTL